MLLTCSSCLRKSAHLFFVKSSFLAFWLLLPLLTLCIVTPAWGQSNETSPVIRLLSDAPSLRFKNLSIQDGMAQSSASNIMQDSHGYLWITTQGGLHRYDGYEFKVFSSSPFDTTSLSDDWVHTVTESKKGGLWVTTEIGGLNYLDLSTETFTHIRFDPDRPSSLASNTVYHVLESSSGDLWVSTLNAGLSRMPAGADNEFIHYWHEPDDPNSLSTDILSWLSEDEQGYIWVSSVNGINRIDPQSEIVTRYLYDSLATPVYGAPQNVFGQYSPSDTPGVMWLATGNGLVRLYTETGNYDRFFIESDENPFVNPVNLLHSVVPDPEATDILWVAGPGTGLARFDIKTNEFISYRHIPTDAKSLPDDFSQSLFVDRSGTMWVGHTTEGMSSFNPAAVKFTHFSNNTETEQSLAPGLVWSIYEDSHGSLWVGSEVGVGGIVLTHFDVQTQQIRRYRHNPNDSGSLLPGIIWAFAENDAGELWIAGEGGLSLFNRSTGRFIHHLHDDTEENWGRNNIIAMKTMALNPNNFWVGSFGGLDVFNSLTREYTRIDVFVEGEEFEPSVLSLFEDETNTLWFGSTFGLMRYNVADGAELVSFYDPLDPSGISGDEIESLHGRVREPGVLWLAPFNRGLNRFDINTGLVTHYTREQGLPSNTVYGILEAEDGTLWLSTNAGISHFNPETGDIRNYGLEDGLIALEYNQGAYSKGKDGTMYLGSARGVTSFEPGQLHINEIPPQIVITGFKLFNRRVTPGPGSPLSGPLREVNEIILRHNQKEIAFEFVALHYSNSAKNAYAYMLEGLDNDWIQAGSQRLATYTNVTPGDYIFRVKAANSDGVWNNQDASIKLTVLPPWWKTWWAYGFYFVMIIVGLVGVDRYQRKRLLQKEREEAREKELAQAKEIEKAYRNLEVAHKDLKSAQDQLVQQEKLASLGQLTAGIAHEIKNPLNFVNNFAELSVELIDELNEDLDSLSPDLQVQIDALSDAAKSTFNIENSKLTLADIQANLRKIHEHGSRADSIVKSMLMHSRGSDGKMEPTSLNPLVKEYVNLAFHGMRAGKDPINVDIQMDLDETISEIPLIAEDFSRVILNLTNNAFDAMRESEAVHKRDVRSDVRSEVLGVVMAKPSAMQDSGHSSERSDGHDSSEAQDSQAYKPKLIVRTKSEYGQITIEIEDNGPGIPDEIKDKILQPFFTTKKGTQGTGLGLSITHDIIKAHGGSLGINSQPGQTTFIIHLEKKI
jgi:signal transduction histidine kinase/ligand-binding sensor domain-containing protein